MNSKLRNHFNLWRCKHLPQISTNFDQLLSHKFWLVYGLSNAQFHKLAGNTMVQSMYWKNHIWKSISVNKYINYWKYQKKIFPFLLSYWRDIHLEKQQRTFFLFIYSHLNTWEVRRILESCANPQLHLRFASLKLWHYCLNALPKIDEKNSTKENDNFDRSLQGSSTSQYNNNLDAINKKLLQ